MKLLIVIFILMISCSEPIDKIIIKGKISLVDGQIDKALIKYKASWLISSPVKIVEINNSGLFEIILYSEDHISISFGHKGYEPSGLEFDPQFGSIYAFNVILDKYKKSSTNNYYVVYSGTQFQIQSENQKLVKNGSDFSIVLNHLPDSLKTLQYQITYPNYRTFPGSQNVSGFDSSLDFFSNVSINNGNAEIIFNDSNLIERSSKAQFVDIKNMEYEIAVREFFNLGQSYQPLIGQKLKQGDNSKEGLEPLFISIHELIKSKKEDKTKWYLAFLAQRYFSNYTEEFNEGAEKAAKYAESNIKEALYENFNIISSIASLRSNTNSENQSKEEYIVQFYKDLVEQKISPFMKLNIYQLLADHYKTVSVDSINYKKYTDLILNIYPDTYNARSIRRERNKTN